MVEEAETVVRHYGGADILGRVLAALRAEGTDPERLAAADLRGMDQLHLGGFPATEAMAALAGVEPGMRVLDAGSGLGGSARFLAESRGAQVEAVDLTPDYVAAAEELNRLCGLAGRIRSRVASVTDLPFGDGEFDLVWSQYVAMNVADKAALFAEAFRVLRPGGRLAFAGLAQGPEGPPHYPLPWAREPGYSFLLPPEAMLGLMAGAGFTVVEAREPEGEAAPDAGEAGLAPRVVVMGDDMSERRANLLCSLAEGRLRPMLVLARRPA